MGLTLYPENWNASRFPARHGGTGKTGTPHLHYTKCEKKDPANGKYVWDESYLKSLLMNPVYCGDMASQKRYYRFKIGNQGDKAPEDWITVRDTHEAIIPQDVFDHTQEDKGRKRETEQGEYACLPDYSAVQSVAVR